MPTVLHEVLLMLFRARPVLAAELIRDALGVALPDFDTVETTDASLSQVVPTEYRADLVVLLRAGTPVLGIVVEVQLGCDDDKAYTWPLYGAALRARYQCPCCVLVVAPDEGVARWAALPVDTGQPGCSFVPLVLGPGVVPVVTDHEVARSSPELAMLSVLSHGRGEVGTEVAMAALSVVPGLDEDTAMLYFDLIQSAVSAAVRRTLEALMRIEGYEFQSEILRKNYSKGRAEGKAEALLCILAARGLEVSESQRARIMSCGDVSILEEWLRHALHIGQVDELFS